MGSTTVFLTYKNLQQYFKQRKKGNEKKCLDKFPKLRVTERSSENAGNFVRIRNKELAIANYLLKAQNLEKFGFCDLTLICEGGSIDCHSHIISMASPFLGRLILETVTEGEVPSEKSRLAISLPDITKAELSDIVFLFYTGVIELHGESKYSRYLDLLDFLEFDRKKISYLKPSELSQKEDDRLLKTLKEKSKPGVQYSQIELEEDSSQSEVESLEDDDQSNNEVEMPSTTNNQIVNNNAQKEGEKKTAKKRRRKKNWGAPKKKRKPSNPPEKNNETGDPDPSAERPLMDVESTIAANANDDIAQNSTIMDSDAQPISELIVENQSAILQENVSPVSTNSPPGFEKESTKTATQKETDKNVESEKSDSDASASPPRERNPKRKRFRWGKRPTVSKWRASNFYAKPIGSESEPESGEPSRTETGYENSPTETPFPISSGETSPQHFPNTHSLENEHDEEIVENETSNNETASLASEIPSPEFENISDEELETDGNQTQKQTENGDGDSDQSEDNLELPLPENRMERLEHCDRYSESNASASDPWLRDAEIINIGRINGIFPEESESDLDEGSNEDISMGGVEENILELDDEINDTIDQEELITPSTESREKVAENISTEEMRPPSQPEKSVTLGENNVANPTQEEIRPVRFSYIPATSPVSVSEGSVRSTRTCPIPIPVPVKPKNTARRGARTGGFSSRGRKKSGIGREDAEGTSENIVLAEHHCYFCKEGYDSYEATIKHTQQDCGKRYKKYYKYPEKVCLVCQEELVNLPVDLFIKHVVNCVKSEKERKELAEKERENAEQVQQNVTDESSVPTPSETEISEPNRRISEPGDDSRSRKSHSSGASTNSNKKEKESWQIYNECHDLKLKMRRTSAAEGGHNNQHVETPTPLVATVCERLFGEPSQTDDEIQIVEVIGRDEVGPFGIPERNNHEGDSDDETPIPRRKIKIEPDIPEVDILSKNQLNNLIKKFEKEQTQSQKTSDRRKEKQMQPGEVSKEIQKPRKSPIKRKKVFEPLPRRLEEPLWLEKILKCGCSKEGHISFKDVLSCVKKRKVQKCLLCGQEIGGGCDSLMLNHYRIIHSLENHSGSVVCPRCEGIFPFKEVDEHVRVAHLGEKAKKIPGRRGSRMQSCDTESTVSGHSSASSSHQAVDHSQLAESTISGHSNASSSHQAVDPSELASVVSRVTQVFQNSKQRDNRDRRNSTVSSCSTEASISTLVIDSSSLPKNVSGKETAQVSNANTIKDTSTVTEACNENVRSNTAQEINPEPTTTIIPLPALQTEQPEQRISPDNFNPTPTPSTSNRLEEICNNSLNVGKNLPPPSGPSTTMPHYKKRILNSETDNTGRAVAAVIPTPENQRELRQSAPGPSPVIREESLREALVKSIAKQGPQKLGPGSKPGQVLRRDGGISKEKVVQNQRSQNSASTQNIQNRPASVSKNVTTTPFSAANTNATPIRPVLPSFNSTFPRSQRTPVIPAVAKNVSQLIKKSQAMAVARNHGTVIGNPNPNPTTAKPSSATPVNSNNSIQSNSSRKAPVAQPANADDSPSLDDIVNNAIRNPIPQQRITAPTIPQPAQNAPTASSMEITPIRLEGNYVGGVVQFTTAPGQPELAHLNLFPQAQPQPANNNQPRPTPQTPVLPSPINFSVRGQSIEFRAQDNQPSINPPPSGPLQGLERVLQETRGSLNRPRITPNERQIQPNNQNIPIPRNPAVLNEIRQNQFMQGRPLGISTIIAASLPIQEMRQQPQPQPVRRVLMHCEKCTSNFSTQEMFDNHMCFD